MVAIVSQILDTIDALRGLRDYLPTHYDTAWSDLLGTRIDWGDMTRGALAALVYATMFGGLAILRFAAKDITS
jgi:ABC-2 type transport system permease protein